MVTVHDSSSKSWAIAFPTIFDLPIITACIPAKFGTLLFNIRKHPNGVQGTNDFFNRSPPIEFRPTLSA